MLRRFLTGRVVLAGLVFAGLALASPVRLRCEHRDNPLGIDSRKPRFSWQSDSLERNWRQSAYQVLVATRPELLASKADVWDSGKRVSDESIGIVYAGPELKARTRYFWTVRVWDAAGKPTTGSAVWWETGLLGNDQWTAKWITRTNPDESGDRASMHWIWVAGQNALSAQPKTSAAFRGSFDLAAPPKSGAIFVIARGDAKFKVNGHDVGCKPNWRDFDRQDVTNLLTVGKNTVEINVTVQQPAQFGPSSGEKPNGAVAAMLKITGADGNLIRVSSGGNWEGRLVSGADWKPVQVVAGLDDPRLGPVSQLPQPAALFRAEFTVAKRVRSARLYATALGSYRIMLNGRAVGSSVLTPEFTDYRKRVFYQTYDVTNLLTPGENAIGAMLGDGWFSSPLTWTGEHFYPGANRLRAQLKIQYADGSGATVNSDGTWTASSSPIVHSTIYAGETYDARLEQPGWNRAGFKGGANWAAAAIGDAPTIQISDQVTASPAVGETILPKSMKQLPNGVQVYDMGQNMVGWVTLKVQGPAGRQVRLRFAEILNPDGSIYRENLRNADAADLYTLRGSGPETFTPTFTFHGFRYVELTGYPGKADPGAITGHVVSSLAGAPSGKLVTSNALVNKMWKIGIWGQLGNFLSIPTDCPQRDERLGWMGDAGVFWRTGSYNFDIEAFTRMFMYDVIDGQMSNGAFANTSPDLLDPKGLPGAPGWGDAGVIVPWNTWQQYGDRRFIDDNWAAMERWMEYIHHANPDYVRKNGNGPNFADWLAPDERSPQDLVGSAYWALISNMMSQMAKATGRDAEASRYAQLTDHIRAAYQKTYINEKGEVKGGTQTAYLLTLYTKMAPKALESAIVDRLVKDIDSRGGHLSTGFLGTPFLLLTLAEYGRADVAYKLLLNETYPSWGYMLSKGATTWWERWNGDTGDPAMNSYNHYAFGSVVAWVYRSVAGIDTDPSDPGFHKIIVRPLLDPRITKARGEYDSVYGKVVSDWSGTAGGPFSLKLTVPANTNAKVYLPYKPGASITEGGKVLHTEQRDGAFLVQVGSGSYSFMVQ